MVHKLFVVHRDIKPQNFMLNGGDLVLIDFGFSSFYLDGDGKHCEIVQDREHLIGSLPYISYYVHCGYGAVRRDDVLGVFYILLFMVYGKLEWEDMAGWRNCPEYTQSSLPRTSIYHPLNIWVRNLKCLDNVMKFCIETPTRIIDGHKYIPCIIRLTQLIYELSFAEMPNYDLLSNIFDNIP